MQCQTRSPSLNFTQLWEGRTAPLLPSINHLLDQVFCDMFYFGMKQIATTQNTNYIQSITQINEWKWIGPFWVACYSNGYNFFFFLDHCSSEIIGNENTLPQLLSPVNFVHFKLIHFLNFFICICGIYVISYVHVWDLWNFICTCVGFM